MHHHPTPMHCPPSPFHTVRLKPSHSGSVSDFQPKPAPRLAFRKRTTPPPPLPRTHHHPTPTQRPPLPFHTARLKPSHSGSVSDFGPKFTPRLAFHKHATPPPPLPRIHHHPPLRNIPRCCFTWHTQNRATAAWFRIFDPNPLPALRFANAQPHHHHHHPPTAPPPPTAPHFHFRWRTRNRAPVA